MGLKERLIKKVEAKVPKLVDKALKKIPEEKRAGVMADSLRKVIRFTGVPEMRRRVIKGVGDEFKEKKEKNPGITVDELIGEYLEEPKAMALFKDLDMNEEHLRVMAQEVIDGKEGANKQSQYRG